MENSLRRLNRESLEGQCDINGTFRSLAPPAELLFSPLRNFQTVSEGEFSEVRAIISYEESREEETAYSSGQYLRMDMANDAEERRQEISVLDSGLLIL